MTLPVKGKTIHLIRHAQALHNIADDFSIPDAVLTEKGRNQAIGLLSRQADFAKVQLLVCSPQRRTMQTMLLGLPGLIERLGKGSTIILPLFQEIHSLPCDTGSDRKDLVSNPEFASLDLSTVEEGWNSNLGIYAGELAEERARLCRMYLRERPESEIVVMAHGGLLRMMAQQPRGLDPWSNAEVRTFTFASMSPADEEASLVRIDPKT